MSSTPEITEGRITAGDLEFAYLEAGSGPLALCLHGFPDTPWTWRHLLPALAEAGFRAVAPWMRGYAPTQVPPDGRYQTGALALDACNLHEALGGDADAVIVGHDWGALATYPATAWQPDRWRRVVTMSIPPMSVLMGGMMGPAQLKRSWYIWFFQMAGLPEVLVPADDFALVRTLWQDWSPGLDGAADVARVAEALADPANLAAAIGYYRNLFDTSGHDPALADAQAAALAPTPQPTLLLHGRDDGCIGSELVTDAVLAGLPAEGSRYEILEGAGHFLQLEQPERVNQLVIEHLTG